MPPPKRPKHWDTSESRGSQIILLSCFEGIGIAAMVLQDLVGPLALHVSWECDPECLILLRRHFPSAHHRGDFLQDDVTEVAALIRQVDPRAEMTIVQAGAPPCPDFSHIKEDAPGKEGWKAVSFPSTAIFPNQFVTSYLTISSCNYVRTWCWQIKVKLHSSLSSSAYGRCIRLSGCIPAKAMVVLHRLVKGSQEPHHRGTTTLVSTESASPPSR